MHGMEETQLQFCGRVMQQRRERSTYITVESAAQDRLLRGVHGLAQAQNLPQERMRMQLFKCIQPGSYLQH